MIKVTFLTLFAFLLTSCATRLTDNKKTALKNELAEMVKTDQIAAFVRQGKYKTYTQEQWDRFKDSVYTTHQKRIAVIFRQYGFPGIDMVGKDGSNHFWLLVQHSDKFPEFQTKVLKAMEKEVKKQNANPDNYAYLYDRVQVNAGKKQRFGTQVSYLANTTGRAFPKIGLIDSANVDKIRKEYSLSSLKDYLNNMTEMHYEMNKKIYQEKGVMKPDLY
ncbi:hypothetical protein SAMN04488128_105347 [Chitinophaga eiseniae]|uniref:Lipoprotein n=1 Tax=Chitinophaga eiseniae TaxID=634771 RepID=A0A1T4TL97_9BACT|nr:DUF6624 domain-containing protein [Chitinophaga eiseniae]SKA41154.1 hypothetical protein SAMN04488128_105347 [Chitinophaga eiseniae]